MSNYSTKFVEQSGVGASEEIKFPQVSQEFAMLINAYVTGTVTYDIEYTIDPANPAQWVALGDVDRSASGDESFYFPPKAIRVNVKTGTGSVKLVTKYRV